MSSSATCRVCLLSGGNVRFHPFRNTPLQDFFEKLTNLKLNIKDGKPDTLCYICRWQLHFCRTFRNKAEKSDGVLAQLLNHGIQISYDTIAILNREISPQYSVTPLECSTYCPQSEDLVKGEKQESIVEEVNDTQDSVGKNDESTCEGTVCRVCLNVNKNHRSIKNTVLQTVYEKLVQNALSTDGIPESVCYICLAQLHRVNRFIDQAKKSDTILTELIRNGIQLTPSSYYILNRRVRLQLSRSEVDSQSCGKAERLVGLLDQFAVPVVRIERMVLPIKRELRDEHEAYNSTSSSDVKKKLPSNTKSAPKNKGKTFFCRFCNYGCDSESTLANHQQFHDQNRPLACKICRYRFNRISNLNGHIKRCHNKKHKCLECGEAFSNKRSVKRHMFVHYKGTKFTCDLCKKVYVSKRTLYEHYYMSHPDIKRTCDRCPLIFKSEQLTREHILMVHAGQFPYYICDICNKQFHDKSVMRKHMLYVHVKKVSYQCYYCDKTFPRKMTLKIHMQMHTGKLFKCPVCPRSYTSKAALQNHSTKHTGERPFSCKICKKTYREKRTLASHIKTHKGERPFVCEICLKAYANINSLNYHNITVHSQAEKSFACELCDKKFHRKYDLNSHVKIYHEKTPVKRPYLPCDLCSKVLRSEKGYEKHIKAHAGHFLYTCYECHKSFNYKNNYRIHMKFHYGLTERKFICAVCDKRFRTKTDLEIHNRSHTKEKPYACDLCSKSYSQNGNLNKHMRTHTGEKPYKCETCHKGFAEKRTLEQHVIIYHTDKKKLICDICFKVYTSRDMFIRHIKKHDTRTPHTCYKCEDAFCNLKTLSEHMESHKNTNCGKCGETFGSVASLRRHNLAVHGPLQALACNICEKGFNIEEIDRLKRHIRRHRGEKPYQCEICNVKLMRSLNRHMKRYHS